MVKEKKSRQSKKALLRSILLYFFFGGLFASFAMASLFIYLSEKEYSGKVYPGVTIDGLSFGGKNPKEIEDYFVSKSLPFTNLVITFSFEDKIATISGKDLHVAYDGKLSSIQAYSIGRSQHLFSNVYQKWQARTSGINLSSVLNINYDYLDDTLDNLGREIDISPKDALFQFQDNKVTLFATSSAGRKLNLEKTKQLVQSYIFNLARQDSIIPANVDFNLPVETVFPKVTTESSNTYGIKELLGLGTSKFYGSIPARVHNIELAASHLNGHLIAPGGIFSFNDTLGDVSATTGFQPAYIIKEGRTVLGDGGGVCQVSTTLFRAALNTGLPITERYAHAYRVSYYEQESPVGIDATVFAPSHDLKFKNNTDNYLLIQAKTDVPNYSLTFEIYGTKDSRLVEMTKPVFLSQSPPLPDLYQDDPTLPKGVVKQVDWKAPGAKVSFDYKVSKNGEMLTKDTFFSNYKPWQAVFLRGTKE